MSARIFQVDAFTTRRFAGNPAAVMPMMQFPADEVMQAIAAENNLAETAFFVPEGRDYQLRWFTPAVEVPLCGHATLASAAVIMERLEPGRDTVTFHSASGPLSVRRTATGYSMDFPSRPMSQVTAPPLLVDALGLIPVEVVSDAFAYLVRLETSQLVRNLTPDLSAIARLDRPGVIVTAAGDHSYDFVSRYFAPQKGIPEDPVTGGAHCALAPFWSQRLAKMDFRAFQASSRGGEILCRVKGSRIELEGSCVFYMEGQVEI